MQKLKIGLCRNGYVPVQTAVRSGDLFPNTTEFLYLEEEDGSTGEIDGVLGSNAADWAIAAGNTCLSAQVVDVSGYLEKLNLISGKPASETKPEVKLVSITFANASGYGAAGVISQEALKQAAKMLGTTDLLIAPTSIHEVLITALSDEAVQGSETAMKKILETLPANEQLGEHAVPYTVKL